MTSRHTWVALPAPYKPECRYPFSLFLKISSSCLIRDGAPSGKNLFALSKLGRFPQILLAVPASEGLSSLLEVLPSSREEGSAPHWREVVLPKVV